MHLHLWQLIFEATTILFVVSATTLPCANPNKWAGIGKDYYLFSPRKFKFQEGIKYCEREGGSVVRISSDLQYTTVKGLLYTKGGLSSWVDPSLRPEKFSSNSENLYARYEPNFTGECLYLSKSNGFRWKDTDCGLRKRVICHRKFACNFVEVDLTNSNITDKSKCRIIGKVYRPCIFPFKYNGVTHTKCTDKGDFQSKFWCSTATDPYRNHIPGTNWGYCDPENCKKYI